MPGRPFTKHELAVILSLIRNPEHSDKEIASAIGMNLFTFNKIKNSLKQSNRLRKFYIPNYPKIGFEILCVIHGSGMEPMSSRTRREHMMREIDPSFPHHSIFSMIEADNGLMFHALRDFTTLKRALRMKNDIVASRDLEIGSLKHIFFSFRDLRIKRFFDVESLIEREIPEWSIPRLKKDLGPETSTDIFPLDKEGRGNGNGSIERGSVEYDVLLDLVRDGEASPGDRISRLKLSRYRLNRIREELLSKGMVRPFYAMDIMSLGYNVMIFSHISVKGGVNTWEVFEGLEERVMPKNLMIVAYDHSDFVGLGIFRDLAEGTAAQAGMRREMMKLGFLKKDPDIAIFSLPNCYGDLALTFHRPMEDDAVIGSMYSDRMVN